MPVISITIYVIFWYVNNLLLPTLDTKYKCFKKKLALGGISYSIYCLLVVLVCKSYSIF